MCNGALQTKHMTSKLECARIVSTLFFARNAKSIDERARDTKLSREKLLDGGAFFIANDTRRNYCHFRRSRRANIER